LQFGLQEEIQEAPHKVREVNRPTNGAEINRNGKDAACRDESSQESSQKTEWR
jgi:hypothetical protein